MSCVIYSNIQKFGIITIIKTVIYIMIKFIALILPYSRKFSEGLIFGDFQNLVRFPKINFRKCYCVEAFKNLFYLRHISITKWFSKYKATALCLVSLNIS